MANSSLFCDVLHLTSSLADGGAERILYTIVQEYHQRNVSQVVLYIHDGPYQQKLQALGIPVYPLTLVTLVRYARRARVMMTWLWAANIIGRLMRVLTSAGQIATFHHMPMLEGPMRQRIDRWCPGQPTRAIAVSPAVVAAYAHEHPWCTAPWTVIPNGVNVPSLRALVWQAGETLHLLTVGRFVDVKRIDRVIDTLKLLHTQGVTAHLTIVGHGPLEQQLRAQADGLGLTSAITWVINQDALPWYTRTHIYIQLSESESFSLTTAQALAYQQPCVVSGMPDVHPIITHEQTGLVISHGDPAQAAAAIIRTLSDPEATAARVAAGYDLVCREYTYERMVQGYTRLLDEELAKTGSFT